MLKYYDKDNNLKREIPKNNLWPFNQDEKYCDFNGDTVNNPDFDETTAKQRVIDLIVNNKELTDDAVSSYVLPIMINNESNVKVKAVYTLMLNKVTERLTEARQKILINS